MKNRNYYIMQINIFDEISFSGSFYNTWKKHRAPMQAILGIGMKFVI